jgi:hypothetical protein
MLEMPNPLIERRLSKTNLATGRGRSTARLARRGRRAGETHCRKRGRLGCLTSLRASAEPGGCWEASCTGAGRARRNSVERTVCLCAAPCPAPVKNRKITGILPRTAPWARDPFAPCRQAEHFGETNSPLPKRNNARRASQTAGLSFATGAFPRCRGDDIVHILSFIGPSQPASPAADDRA